MSVRLVRTDEQAHSVVWPWSVFLVNSFFVLFWGFFPHEEKLDRLHCLQDNHSSV